MKSGMFDFLKTVKVEEVEEAPKAKRGVKKPWNPDPLMVGFRVWKDGAIFPSQAAVDKFDLEYRTAMISFENVTARATKVPEGMEAHANAIVPGPTEAKTRKVFTYGEGGPGNGFDVFSSSDWGQFKGDGKIIFVSPVVKTEAKVDLFSTVGMDEKGKPLNTVLDQGAATYGEQTLLPMLKEMYDIELGEEKEYVDLEIVESIEGFDIVGNYSRDIMLLPKKITRGADKGKADYVRRENQKVYALVPVEVLAEEPALSEA